MTNLQIRDAVQDDRIAIREVTLAAYQEYASDLPAEHWQLYRQEILRTLADVGPASKV